MKKKIIISILILTMICSLFMLVACDFSGGKTPGGDTGSGDENPSGDNGSGDAPIVVESVAFAEKTLTLEIGQEYDLGCTVTPVGGKVEFTAPKGDLISYTVDSDGKVKIKALTSGTGNLKVNASDNAAISDICGIKVNPPAGYTQYQNDTNGVKMLIPQTWSKGSQTSVGMVFSYEDGITGNNVNMSYQVKSNAHLQMTADQYKEVLLKQYETMGITVSDAKCTLQKYDTDAVFITMGYTLSSAGREVTIYQEQFIRNSSKRTYCVTLTYVDKTDMSYTQVLKDSFKAW